MSTSTSSFTPSESPQSQLSPDFPCVVCGNSSQGTHFGAQTCRACAAFFRRTVVLSPIYRCRKAEKKCEIDKFQSKMCRFCRYKKCVKVGMIPDNVQWNRDVASSTVAGKRERREKEETERSVLPGWRRRECVPPAFDLTNVFRKIRRIFSKFDTPSDPVYLNGNTLTRMDWALRQSRKRAPSDEFRIVDRFHLNDQVVVWSDFMKQAAEWMMHAEEFRELSASEKFKMFFETWHSWVRLDKIQQSYEVFGERVVTEKLLMMTHSEACRVDEVHLDFSPITDRPATEIIAMFLPVLHQLFSGVVKPIVDLNASSIELTFLLCHVTSHIASCSFPDSKIAEAAEKFIEKVSNDLHAFYVSRRETSNYAARLIRLMAVVNALEKVYKERRKVMDLANLFDVFTKRISEPCFFS